MVAAGLLSSKNREERNPESVSRLPARNVHHPCWANQFRSACLLEPKPKSGSL